MDEEKIPYSFHSADETPIPVPPVEEAWALMKKKLDEQMPVRRRWYERWGLWFFFGVVFVTGMLLVWGVGRRTDGPAGAGLSASTGVSARTGRAGGAGVSGGAGRTAGEQGAAAPRGGRGASVPTERDERSQGDLTRDSAENTASDRAGAGGETANAEGSGSAGKAAGAEEKIANAGGTAGARGTAGVDSFRTAAGAGNRTEKRARLVANGRHASWGNTTVRKSKHATWRNGTAATGRHASRGNRTAGKSKHANWGNGTAVNSKHAKWGNGTAAAKSRHARWANGEVPGDEKHATRGSETGVANGRHARWGNGTMAEDGRHARWGNGVSRASTQSAAPKFVPAADSMLRALRGNRTAALAAMGKGMSGSNLAKAAAASKAMDSLKAKTSKADTKKDKLHDRSGVWMTAGLSLGQTIAVGGQQSVSFNANAKSNIFSDYIPAPYFRLHIGSRLYVQTAFHFNSPQYVRSQRVDSTASDTANSAVTGYSYRTDLILKKLYYWDVPLSVHYRVFDGLSLGAGIQYSKLTGAIGQNKLILSPTNGGKDSIFDQHLISLKSDSGRGSYKKLSGSDWRILFEADYQWRRWTLGLRYERGLKAYWPVQLDGTAGKDKNSSLSLHLYYDLWQSGRKKKY